MTGACLTTLDPEKRTEFRQRTADRRPRTDNGSTLAGASAAFAGIAWITWAALNARTHGGLDVGAAAVGERVARIGQLLMVAWNVFLIPGAVSLHTRLVALAPERVRIATVCGCLAAPLVLRRRDPHHHTGARSQLSVALRRVVGRDRCHRSARDQMVWCTRIGARRFCPVGRAAHGVRACAILSISHRGSQTAALDPLGLRVCVRAAARSRSIASARPRDKLLTEPCFDRAT